MSSQTSPIIHTRLKDIIDPSHTALVVWDVQNLLVERIFNREDFLKNCRSLLDKARKSRIPVVYTKITPLPREYESPFRTYMFMKRFGVDDPEKVPQFLIPGTPEAEIHQEIFPQKGDLVLDKHTASIFIGTHFEQMMRVKGIQTIIFTGITTEIGIASSARDSANRGFYTIVVEDCVSSPDKEMHEYALKILKRVCIVSSSQDLMKVWE
jgi:nicotinamidase-related amidase